MENKVVTSKDSAAFIPPAGGHVTLVVNVPKGFDLVVANLHPTAPLDMGTQMDSSSDKISLLSIPSGAEAQMGLEIRDEAQHADIVFLIPRNTGVGIKLEPR